MKHSKLIAALGTVGGLFAMSSAHAIAPLALAGIAALGGAAVGSAATQASPPPVAVVQPAPVAVVPENATVVMGAGPVVEEVVPAPRAGYHWERGHYEVQNGTSLWVQGHWVPTGPVIYEH